jgi:hypothetical protein
MGFRQVARRFQYIQMSHQDARWLAAGAVAFQGAPGGDQVAGAERETRLTAPASTAVREAPTIDNRNAGAEFS